MITKNDWDAAADEFMLAERERLGGPPTPEEVIAYSRGELSEPEAARVRALLVYYPDLADILDDPAPPRRIAWARMLPIAAAVLLAFVTAISQWQVQRLTRTLHEPRIGAAHGPRHELVPALQRRGPSAAAPYLLPASEKKADLVLLPNGTPQFPAYRVKIIDARGKEQWSSPSMMPTNEGTFELTISREFFDAGTYRIDLYGVRDGDEELLQTYAIRIAGDR